MTRADMIGYWGLRRLRPELTLRGDIRRAVSLEFYFAAPNFATAPLPFVVEPGHLALSVTASKAGPSRGCRRLADESGPPRIYRRSNI